MGTDRVSSIISLTEYALSIDAICSKIHSKIWMATEGPSVLRFILPRHLSRVMGSCPGPSLGRRLYDVYQWLCLWASWHLSESVTLLMERRALQHISRLLRPWVIVGQKVCSSRISETNDQIGTLGLLDFLVALNQDMLRLWPLAECQELCWGLCSAN